MADSADQLIQRALQNDGLNLYLDTNFLLDLVRPERRSASVDLFDEACSRGWSCSSSFFAQMEALDVEQEHAWFLARLQAGQHTEKLLRRRRQRDLTSDELREVFKRFMTTLVERDLQGRIQWLPLTRKGGELEEALALAAETNISAPDCLHLATALQAGCDILVTSDEGLKNAARPYIPAVKPEELLAAIRAKRE